MNKLELEGLIIKGLIIVGIGIILILIITSVCLIGLMILGIGGGVTNLNEEKCIYDSQFKANMTTGVYRLYNHESTYTCNLFGECNDHQPRTKSFLVTEHFKLGEEGG